MFSPCSGQPPGLFQFYRPGYGNPVYDTTFWWSMDVGSGTTGWKRLPSLAGIEHGYIGDLTNRSTFAIIAISAIAES
jgi:hypothetical protein